ncbi:hypothetical protein GTW69_03615, partial [Streptomyces sp. SID7760]|nr:hypothetical protein [Streptomyces sp. SID7760]
MQYTEGVRRTSSVLVLAAAAAALMTGCTPTGDAGAADGPTRSVQSPAPGTAA